MVLHRGCDSIFEYMLHGGRLECALIRTRFSIRMRRTHMVSSENELVSVLFISKIGWIVSVDWCECMICFSNRLKMVHKRKFRVGREVIN